MGQVSDLFTMQRPPGSVIEARVFALRSLADANTYSQALARCVQEAPANMRPLLCADHRPVGIYPQVVADRLIELFRSMNSRLERIAILVSPSNATLYMQLGRITKEAGYESRRVVYEPVEALAHLGPLLTPAERERTTNFLAEYIVR